MDTKQIEDLLAAPAMAVGHYDHEIQQEEDNDETYPQLVEIPRA